MAIPLPAMMRKWRERDFERGDPPLMQLLALRLWAYAAKRPRLYHALSGTIAPLLARLAGRRGHFNALPFAHAWTDTRDLPAPQGKTFHELYGETRRSESK
jgi:L-lactate dehydrogenase complex protein LldF